MLFIWLVMGSAILLLVPQSVTGQFQLAFAHVFRWPLSLGRTISLSTHVNQRRENVVPRDKYEQLEVHVANLQVQLRQAQLKIEQLSNLRQRYPLSGAGFVPAQVITANITPLRCELVINRGQDEGIRTGQFVLADNSVIGTVISVDSRTARIRLITDRESKIAVKIGDADRFMHGCGDSQARVPMIKTKVPVGAKVVASEKAGFLDVPMVVGDVVQCENNSQSALLWDLIVEPVGDLGKLQKVTVVVMNPD